MTGFQVCYIAYRALDPALEGHNIASVGIIEAAVRAGINVQVVTLEESRVTSKKDFHPVKSLARKRYGVLPASYSPSVGEIVSSVPAMQCAKALHCDFIHLLNVTKEIFLLTRTFLRMNRPCIIHLFHSHFPFLSYKSFKFRLLLFKLGVFDHLLSSNKLLMHYLTEEAGLTIDNIHYVPYPVDVERFKPYNKEKLREKYGFPTHAPIIAYVGAMDPNRGFFLMLKAFKRVLKEIPEALLYICDPHRKREERVYEPLFQSVVNQKLKGNIVIHGPNPFIEETYSVADVIALPFQQPHWVTAPPLVLLEAMASATPIVATPVDVIKEIGTNKRDMIFATPGDLDSLVKAIVYVLKNQDEANKIGLRARENAAQNFSMETVGEKLRETYKKIREF